MKECARAERVVTLNLILRSTNVPTPTDPPRSLCSPSRRKMFSAFLICARRIFSFKNEENIFLRDSAFLNVRQAAGQTIWTSAKRKIFFSGVYGFFRFASGIFVLSPRAERGLGNECARAFWMGAG